MDSCHKIDYGLYALEILAQYHNVSVNPEEIKHRFDTDGTGLGLTSWLLAAKSLEL
ncbi:cysteine peptidase family C39 domain-containing protein, partial [Escherichia coli]|nr:peptidase C39 [Escherichia coli]EFB1872623.1 peptidase C39 [Escherichia coli]EFF3281335.1 peptidase C39 [Escherichia coli]EFI5992389.1 peptidase C39 [Escherichia coli]EHH0331366.1 peptidase C39 [Escherichia coli]